MKFTEEQAINITIENGYDGAEFETKVWKQRGCLHPNRTLKGLISKLETIYNSVEVIEKGKKRRYILIDKKEQVTEREYNYKGSVPSVEDDIMKEYIFNQLIPFEKEYTQSYKGWAFTLQLINTDSFSIDDLINVIKELHQGFPVIFNPKEVVSKFIQTLNIRNKDVIEKTFQRLEKEKRIRVIEIYNFKGINGNIVEVSQEEYQKAQDCLVKLLQSKGITYYAYTQSVTSLHNSKRMIGIIQEVKKYLLKEFNIQYFFKSFRVKVLDKTVHKSINQDEFIQAYYKRLIDLSQKRQDKKEYKISISFWQKFYLLNTLTLLDFINDEIDELDEILKTEKRLKNEKVDEFILDLKLSQFEADVERKRRRHTFGNI